ncbi:gamma-glutamyl-gamma-aminobutyrate hydrolase family protein [uncultured Clostridium sp.]|uniref:gamma-glutamyl-gamma-aminobutyrate hydrolase family protein n=1 Tax=uncultured Clostridium sp. TaxID=59620 RepID=UPI00262B6D8B|nr:gamma-glutamyl-gamma-aminobutyrate hydrolase family protein [uncultured Clostridium sp.]
MKKKIIGISCNIIKSKDNDSFPGSTLQRIFTDYVEAVKLSGGIPILIPITNDLEVIKNQVSIIDGLIVSGGYDIDPLLYNEEPSKNLGSTSNLRDFCEFNLFREAMKKNIPCLGICRGHQILNVVNGGTLYQDINSLDNFFVSHIQKGDQNKPSHSISIDKNSNLYNIFGEHYKVNSFHHQAIKNVADGFKVSAKALDGTIESIEKIDESNFLMGVQWHPEIMAQDDAKTLELFKYFISKC